ncbi:hypothetical protein ACT3TI_12705 [Psychrobacter sp. AOP22-C1-22]|uniref:hypothetical protein n=1 Tax=Psychrobacter TaxID=497 RepID=UPI001787E5C2|nr:MULTISPECIES: hypothetical protein [Psychrobacter]MBE0407733.1 hypothetical protein [Psychrobacter sp. FME6]
MRYTLGFKLKVIAYYRQGHTGIATAKKFGLDKKIVSEWTPLKLRNVFSKVVVLSRKK